VQVTLRGLGHRFAEGAWLFRGLDLALQPGRTYAVTGPSGSGKSTLLGIVAGWLTPAEGRVERDGVHRIARVFQNPHGAPRRTAADHVALPHLAAGLRPREADARALDGLRAFGLAHAATSPFRALSGGEAQRLMLARALAGGPDLLLVDEPTAQLDPVAAATVNRSLAALRSDGVIVLIATHDPRTRDACTDHIDLQAFRAVPLQGPA
jgi:putative ABC transport system ATP-binding protein/lipoprotein-releasing system ATP-binding protein